MTQGNDGEGQQTRTLGWMEKWLAEYRSRDRLRQERFVERPEGTMEIVVDGERMVDFCSNDYLGLSRIVDREASIGPTGSGASRHVSGNVLSLRALEEAVSGWLGAESALYLSSGFAANAGAVPALAGAGDTILSDQFNHASIVDGCRLSRAEVRVLPHLDLEAYEAALQQRRAEGRCWVLVESLYSMDGDRAPLLELDRLCSRYGAHLYVDEAHALGLFGPEGAGLAQESGIAPEVTIAAMGKGVGASGACIVGPRALREYLWNRCRSLIYSTAPSPELLVRVQRNVLRARNADSLRQRLREKVRFVRESFAQLGISLGGDPASPILPWILGSDRRALEVQATLQSQGIFVQAIRPPTVPEGTARLRLTLSAAHTEEQLRRLVDAARTL